jgi:transcriptional regulator with XRE-family HTH domain
MVDSFGDVLRQLRQDRGWSLTQLGEKINWSRSAVGMVETGERRPSVDFAVICDRVLGTAPILTTLLALTGEDNDMNRRALLRGFTVAAGVGAMTSYASMADVFRQDLLESAGLERDWDAVVGAYQYRLVMAPDATLGDELLASMLSARHQMSERTDTDTIKASAHLSLLYALWMGYSGNVGTSHSYFRTASLLAAGSRDRETEVYVQGRIASAGPYQGLTHQQTETSIELALSLAGNTASAGALEAHAARVHLAALTGDLSTGRQSINRMWALSEVLPQVPGAVTAAQRTASFHAYLEGKVGTLADSQRALGRAQVHLENIPQWLAEAQLYAAHAMIRHGHIEAGIEQALKALSGLRYTVRVVRFGVDDVLSLLPPGYHSDAADELRQYGTTGPKPWELVII